MISKIQQYFSQSGLLRNSATLIAGTILAQLLPILFQPLLRRMYGAEDFGTAALYITAVGMLVAIANLKYESAIVLPEKDAQAKDLVSGGIIISAVLSFFIWLYIFLNEPFILSYFKLDYTAAWYLHFLPLSVFLVSSFQCFNYYLIRKKAFKDSAKNKVYRRASEVASQTSGGILKLEGGLLFGNLVGDVVNFFGGFLQAQKVGFSFIFNFKSVFETLRIYLQFPIYHAVPSLLNTMSLTLPVFIVNHAFGREQTGQFDLSRMVLSLPMALISIALSQVYLQHQAEKIRQKLRISGDFKKVSRTLFALSVPFAVILFFFASPLFAFVFGEDWALAGELTAVLIFGQTFKFIVSPLSSTLVALQEVRFSALWQVLYFSAIMWLYFQPGQTIQAFVWHYGLIDLVAYCLYFALIYWRIQLYEKNRA
ncbi:MAG: lipopolysaccharide biosynthesis protein [Flavobacteriales bacterium]